MPKPIKGKVTRTAEGFQTRVTIEKKRRQTFLLPTCRTQAEAEARSVLLAEQARRLRRAGHIGSKAADTFLLELSKARNPKDALEAINVLLGGVAVVDTKPEGPTFREVAEEWTSGKLHKRYPDHVKIKKSVDDEEQRFGKLYDTIGDVPLATFTLEDAERAMAKLPEGRTPATRRHYAQLISKVLRLAVYPLRLIERSPLPTGFLPSNKSTKATAWLYPAEDGALLACADVPLPHRVLYGLLAREGCRLGEALSLRWRDLDLARGVVTLDVNKTDEPRAWAMAPGVAEALRHFQPEDKDVPVWEVDEPERLAEVFRRHLEAAGVTRPELFDRTKTRRPIRVHDLRATFVDSPDRSTPRGWNRRLCC
jgi:integrase